MKILNCNTYDTIGGASRANYRLFKKLVKLDVNIKMIVQKSTLDNEFVLKPSTKKEIVLSKIQGAIDSLLVNKYKEKGTNSLFSPSIAPGFVRKRVKELNPEIVHLCWINNGFIKIEDIPKFNKPIVWNFQDMWPITGGCHYDNGCKKYSIKGCYKCPMLKPTKEYDLAYSVWKRKLNAWNNLNLRIVVPSKWLAECVKKSIIFRKYPVSVIPNGLESKEFKKINKYQARKVLGLPCDKNIILFGAINPSADKRKGFVLLEKALRYLSQKTELSSNCIVIFGNKDDIETNLGFQCISLGYLYDEISLSLLYSSADVMCVPSIQEAFGQTASEAMSCGTPVIGFENTGLSDIIDHKINGYLVKKYEIIEFAKGIQWLIDEGKNNDRFSKEAKKKAVSIFDIDVVANKYMKIYEKIVSLK